MEINLLPAETSKVKGGFLDFAGMNA